MYSLADFSDNATPVGEKRLISVKGFFRKSKLVKGYRRKVKVGKKKEGSRKLSNGSKTALGIATLLGVPLATYAALKTRHLGRLKNISNGLVKRSSPPGTYKEKVIVSIGGFSIEESAKETAKKQANAINTGLKKILGKDQRKTTDFISFDHNFNVEGKVKGFTSTSYGLNKALFKQAVTSDLKEAKKLAQQVYDYHNSGQVKKITLVGFSAGSTIGKDVAHILKQKGIDIDLVTLGAPDFRFTPSIKNSLNINSRNDITHIIRSDNAVSIDSVSKHHLGEYLLNNEVQNTLKKYFSK